MGVYEQVPVGCQTSDKCEGFVFWSKSGRKIGKSGFPKIRFFFLKIQKIQKKSDPRTPQDHLRTPLGPLRTPQDPLGPLRIHLEPLRAPQNPLRTPQDPIRTPLGPPQDPLRTPLEPPQDPLVPKRPLNIIYYPPTYLNILQDLFFLNILHDLILLYPLSNHQNN